MADRRLFLGLNNYSSTITTTVSVGSLSLSVALFTSLPSPVSGEYFLLTLSGQGANTPEIIKVTARSGGTLTIVRAQGGTTAQAWAIGAVIEAYITAEDLAQFGQGVDTTGDVKGVGALDLQSGRTAASQVSSGADSFAAGSKNTASGVRSTATGTANISSAVDTTAHGSTNTATQTGATAIGNNCDATGVDSLATGSNATASGLEATAIGGVGGVASQEKSVSIAGGSATAIRAMAIGSGSTCAFAQMENIAATNVLRNGITAFTGDELYAFAGRENVLFGPNISLTQAAADDLLVISIPSGVRYYADEIGLLIVSSTAVTSNPSVSFGVTGTPTALVESTEITEIAVFDRTVFETPIIISGLTTLTFSLTVAATATALVARPYFKGFAVAL